MPEVNGTTYREGTPSRVIHILEHCRASGMRIRVAYGDENGQDWGEVCDVVGYVGRSCGPCKVPLLVYNRRSLGGPAMTENRIVRIETTKGRRLLYQHKDYKPPREV